MIPGDLISAFPHRQFHTLPGLLDSWAALPNSNPNACMPMQGGSLYHFYDGLWYEPVERRTHDLPCERRTRYRLSQPDMVLFLSYTPFTRSKSHRDHNLDCNLDRDREDVPVYIGWTFFVQYNKAHPIVLHCLFIATSQST